MSERVVKVSLVAQVSNYVAGMEQARSYTKKLGDEQEEAKRKAEAQSQAMTQVGSGLIAIGTLAAVGVGVAIKKFADFDQAMSNVSAATMESSENMDRLRQAALDAGARTVFSATEAANAIEELGKAGVSTSDILSGGLDASLDLAAAGNLEVADAAGIAAVALKTFNLRGSDMAHVADLLAAGAGKAMGDVTDLSMALRQSGQVAASTGLSIEETTGALSAFASQGLLGSDAGTSFKAMLQRLTPQSKEAADKMAALGISAYDASGNFVGLEKLSGNLQDSLKGLTVEQRNSALATIFGSDAVRAANVLYTEGADGIGDWIDKVDDSGYASEVAAKRLDNLKGDVEKLAGAFDTAFIQAGSGANDVLRELVQFATQGVENFSKLPEPIQQGTIVVGGLTAAVALASGAFLYGVPKVVEYRAALEQLGPTAQNAGRLVGVLGKGLGILAAVTVAATALDTLKSAIEGDALALEKYNNIVETSASSTDLLASAFSSTNWLGEGVKVEKFATEVGSLGQLIEEVSGSWDLRGMGAFGDLLQVNAVGANHARSQFEALGKSLSGLSVEDASQKLMQLRDDYELTDDQLMQLINLMPDYKAQLIDVANQTGVNVTSTDEAANTQAFLNIAFEKGQVAAQGQADKLDKVSGAADDASGEISDLNELIKNFGSATLDANEAERKFQAAIDDAAASLKENGATLDLNTEQGRANSAALDDMAKSANESAAAAYALSGDQAVLEEQLATSREQVYQQAKAFGMSDEAARAYSEKVVALAADIEKLPPSKTTNIQVETDSAQAELNNFIWNNDGREINIRANVQTFAYGKNASLLLREANGGLVDFFANGGFHENHIAQIAPAGSWRVWAEPETGGEAYIPLAPGKRARSIDIWHETGKRLGMINGYANGGIVPPNYASGGGGASNSYTTTGDTFNASFNVQAPPGLPIEEQVFSAARRLKSRQKVRR